MGFAYSSFGKRNHRILGSQDIHLTFVIPLNLCGIEDRKNTNTNL